MYDHLGPAPPLWQLASHLIFSTMWCCVYWLCLLAVSIGLVAEMPPWKQRKPGAPSYLQRGLGDVNQTRSRSHRTFTV